MLEIRFQLSIGYMLVLLVIFSTLRNVSALGEKCTGEMLFEKNREYRIPQFPFVEDLGITTSRIVTAHEILRKALQQYLQLKDTDLSIYLSRIYEGNATYVDEYGQEIRAYYKVFSFIWEQYNETLCENYATSKFEKDKLDLCSVARFLSHQPVVENHQTLMKAMGDALGTKCHPCTPYKPKQYGETIVPPFDGIEPAKMTPEEKFELCKRYQEDIPIVIISTTPEPIIPSLNETFVNHEEELGITSNIKINYDWNDAVVKFRERLWKNGTVPYTISDVFDQEDRKIIARGLRHIQDKSCIQFIPRTTERDYVAILNGDGCFSQIAKHGGKQDLSLQRNKCINVETVIHQMMHALGFEHEHNRPDRDKYISINEDNLKDGAERNFQKFEPLSYPFWANYDYDLNSIMHYKENEWAKNGNIPTIRSKNSKHKIVGSIDGLLSPMDQLKLNIIYNCDLKLAATVDCPVSNLGAENPCIRILNLGCFCQVKEKVL